MFAAFALKDPEKKAQTQKPFLYTDSPSAPKIRQESRNSEATPKEGLKTKTPPGDRSRHSPPPHTVSPAVKREPQTD